MAESLIKSGDTSLDLGEDLKKEGLLVIKIDSESPPVAWLSGKIIVDARDKVDPRHPRGWTDRCELERYNELVGAVRTACCSSDGNRRVMNEVLLIAGKKLGLNTTGAVVVGEIPEHWKEKNHITRHFFKSLEDLAKLYPPLALP